MLKYAGVLLLLHSTLLEAQKVLYSPFIGNQFAIQVAGKAGNYYWLHKWKTRNQVRRDVSTLFNNKDQSFEIYDNRLNLLKTISSPAFSETILKEYFVFDTRYFDQLVLSTEYNKTDLLLERYSPEGTLDDSGKIIGSFPFIEPGNNFLMARSEDKTKILVVGFESVSSSSPRLHALLFDRDWQQLSYTVYDHPNITQPFVQEDYISYPIDHFNSNPIKLANNGQWMMMSPSRRNHNFLLFHFNRADSGFVFKEIRLPVSSFVEDLALSLNNEKAEVYAGILSRFRYRAIKNVQVIRYSLIKQKFDFDSSYRFNTLTGDKVKNENLIKESFISVA